MIELNNEEKEFKREFIRILKEHDLIYRYKINFINLHKVFFIGRIISFYGLYNNKTFLKRYDSKKLQEIANQIASKVEK